jgi:hypothetical protein
LHEVILLALLAMAASSLLGQNPAAVPKATAIPLPTARPQPTVNPGPFRLDHFLCYLIQPPQFEGKPGLTMLDQFNPKPIPFTLTSRELLCNPVSKNNEPIINRQGHLTAYTMQGPATEPRNIPVIVGNQFGENQRYVVIRAMRFMVPTGKELQPTTPLTNVPPPPPIPRLDHYACYQVKPEAAFQQRNVVLQDQFGRLEGEVYEPAFLCNPAEKLIDNRPAGEVIDRRDHLMCYALKTGFQPKKALIHNQFETREIEAARPAFLCLPSTKQVQPK